MQLGVCICSIMGCACLAAGDPLNANQSPFMLEYWFCGLFGIALAPSNFKRALQVALQRVYLLQVLHLKSRPISCARVSSCIHMLAHQRTRPAQDEIFKQYTETGALWTMCWMNFWCGAYNLAYPDT